MTTTLSERPAAPQDARLVPGEPRVFLLARAMGRLASWPVWLVSATLFGGFAGAFFGTSAPFAIRTVEAICGQAPPDVRFTSSAVEVGGFLGACGVVGREAYRSMQVADLIYPLVFALFMASSLALVISRLVPARPRLLALAVLPFVASAFDYLENACAWMALAAFPDAAPTSSLLGLASAAKTTTSWVSGVLLLGAVAALVVATVGRRAGAPRRPVPTRDSGRER